MFDEKENTYVFDRMYKVFVQTGVSNRCPDCHHFYFRKIIVTRDKKIYTMHCHINTVDMVSARVCYDGSVFPEEHMASTVRKVPRIVPLRTLTKLSQK